MAGVEVSDTPVSIRISSSTSLTGTLFKGKGSAELLAIVTLNPSAPS